MPARRARAAGAAERALRPGRLRLRAPGARRRGGWSASTGSPTPATTAWSCCCPATRRRGSTPRSTGRERGAAEFLAGLDAERAGRRRAAAGGQGADPGAALARRRGRARPPRRAPTRSPPRPGGPGWSRTGAARCWSCARSAAAARTPRSRRCSPPTGSTRAVYAGDDRTDLDAFRRLRELRDEGELETAVCVGVASPEAPPELAEESDLTVDGPGGLAGDARVRWRS